MFKKKNDELVLEKLAFERLETVKARFVNRKVRLIF